MGARSAADYGKVAVVYGGYSAEREISLVSGESVHKALLSAGVDAYKVDPKVDGLAAITDQGFDRVWNALHGRGGEDGVIQGFLELHQIPYTGSGVMASAIAMDKLRTKLLWSAQGLPVAKHKMVSTGSLSLVEADKLLAEVNGCVMVKPIHEGSSVGMARADTAESLQQAVAKAQQFDQEIMLEEWINGEEFTVAVLNGKALPSIRVETPHTFYDFNAKYSSNQTEYHCPSGLSSDDEQALARLSEKAFAALGCFGWGRVDFMRDSKTGDWLLLEVNTVPGMTQSSLVPKAAKVSGISFEELVLKVLDTSFERTPILGSQLEVN
ncbi:D-alanine--D-alanine ligase [Kangiella sediminilitoris]|uniref:D-alanine--D-alanine ligase n=1 Tax=Kangiella sediminilitoris TaxID=1144748 RepID=A0A1B3BCI1_9GAMM|nr:D-alanine--D-alanine ligase [Kangiella sediminilitoris]AOE50463.1 D-alanine--D-alanine ligase [Kangiella sediminilitoris]